jgi:hypothetical protein
MATAVTGKAKAHSIQPPIQPQIVINPKGKESDKAIEKTIVVTEIVNVNSNTLTKSKSRMEKGYWTFDKCLEEARKYSTRTDYSSHRRGSYVAALRYNWIDEVCAHMRLRGKWHDQEVCRKEALKYSSRYEFQLGNKSAYMSAFRKGWLNVVCSHMDYLKVPYKFWHSKDQCIAEAMKYTCRSDFHRYSAGAYNVVARNGWTDDACAHMTPSHMKFPHGHWKVKLHCYQEAIKYKTMKAFATGSGSAYNASRKYGWLSDICTHIRY